MEHEDEAPVGVGEDLAGAALVRLLHLVRDPEDALIPGDSGLKVRDREGDVMQSRARDSGHGILLPSSAVDRVWCGQSCVSLSGGGRSAVFVMPGRAPAAGSHRTVAC